MSRRGDDDRGLSRKRSQQVQAPQHQDPERETRSEEARSHEQDAFGNAFLADLLRTGEPIRADAPPRGEGGHAVAGQDYGGIEDLDPSSPPTEPTAPLGLRMRPRRRDEPPEVDPSGAGLPELRLPPEDPDWIAKQIAAADPDPWIDPAPQMSTAVLEAGLTRWVRSLAPWLTLRGDLAALTLCAPPAPCLQARDGQPLCGTAAAAAIACEVANRVEMDRNRLLTGLEIAAAPVPTGPLDPPGPPDDAPRPEPLDPPDPWLEQCIRSRVDLGPPPLPQPDAPPPETPPQPEDPVDVDAILAQHLGAAPDHQTARRDAVVEACERMARWADASHRRVSACSQVLSSADGAVRVKAVVATHHHETFAAITLLVQVRDAAYDPQIPVEGLHNGLGRAARMLADLSETTIRALACCGSSSERSMPSQPASLDDLRTRLDWGQPASSDDWAGFAERVVRTRAAINAGEDALDSAQAIEREAWQRRDGIGVALGVILALEAGADAAIRDEAGGRLAAVGAHSGLALLSRVVVDAAPQPG